MLRLKKGQEKKVMDASPVTIPAEAKNTCSKAIQNVPELQLLAVTFALSVICARVLQAMVAFGEKFEPLAATRSRITGPLECPAATLGMDALLTGALDKMIEEAAECHQQLPRSLVLDRSQIAAQQPGLAG